MIPSFDPLYPKPPYIYDAQIVVGIIQAGEEKSKLKRFLPYDFEPTGQIVFITGFYPEIKAQGNKKLKPYYETVVLLLVDYKGRFGSFCPFIWVSTDEALCAGREIWGFPKKLAEFSFTFKENRIKALTKRFDDLILSIDSKELATAEPQPINLGETFLEKNIPFADGRDNKKIVSVKLEGIQIEESLAGTATVESKDKHLSDLIPKQETLIFFAKAKLILPFGKEIE